MKREELKALGLSDEMIEGVMKLHNTDVTTHQGELTTKDTKIKDLQGQVTTANKTIGDLNDAVAKFDGSVTKEDLDTQIQTIKNDYEKQLASKDQDFAIDKLFREQNFSSNLARDAAINSFKTKELKFEDGKFLGSDDFFKNLKESDPTVFASEETSNTTVKLGGGVDGGGTINEMDAMRIAMGLPIADK